MTLQWRRSTIEPPPGGDPGDPELVARLRDDIADRGPITFARFMERALYEPDLGYYAASEHRPTRTGDFVTAPELHPVFGRTVARQLDEMWRRLDRPARFTLREYGAGGGALISAVLEGVTEAGSGLADALRYQPVDLPRQLDAVERRLTAAGRRSVLEEFEPDTRFLGCVIANEFLDALPVHRVVYAGSRLQELFVDWHDGRFVEVAAEPSDDRIASWFADAGIVLAEGQRAEVNVAMLDWLAALGSSLERGFALVIDYAAAAAELYGAQRMTGTLRAFRSQHVSSDPFAGVGRQDLTAHVDLDALARGARSAQLDLVGRTTQAEFLIGSGLEQVYAAARAEADSDWASAAALRAAIPRLIDPRGLGGYAVVILSRGVDADPPLMGLAYRAPARR